MNLYMIDTPPRDPQFDELLIFKFTSRLFPSEHAEKFGFGVDNRFVGHGIGTVFHSEPLIHHHRK